MGLERDGILLERGMSYAVCMGALSCWNKGLPRGGSARMYLKTGRSQRAVDPRVGMIDTGSD